MLSVILPDQLRSRLAALLGLALLPVAARAQSRFSFAGDVGAGIALDHLHAPDGLPPNTRQLRRVRGPVLALGVRYAWRPRWQLTTAIRGAGLAQGFKVSRQVLQRDASGQVTAWMKRESWLGYNRPQLTAGVRHQLGTGKLRLVPELGLGYMVDVSYLDQHLGFGGGSDYTPEEEFRLSMSRRLLRRGNWGGYASLSAQWHLSPRSAVELTLYGHRGLHVMSELRAEYFQYLNHRDNVQRDYRVSISTRGSYVAGTAAYVYTL